jgi:hypothetical protein
LVHNFLLGYLAGVWCWFVLRKKYYLLTNGWWLIMLTLSEKKKTLLAEKPNDSPGARTRPASEQPRAGGSTAGCSRWIAQT